MSKKLHPKTLAILTLLASASAAMSGAEVFAAVPGEFNDSSACLTQLANMRGRGLVSSNKVGDGPMAWEITAEGRGACESGKEPPRAATSSTSKKATKKPAAKKRATKKPGAEKADRRSASTARDVPPYKHSPAAEPNAPEPETTEAPEIDFALWASGVLTVQIGEDTQLLPRADAERLRDYLMRHLPREVPTLKSEIFAGPLLGIGGGFLGRLFADPDPAFDFEKHLARQSAWSERTFGPGARVNAICDHITKELVEVKDSKGSLAEWIDVVILGLDGCWRSGATPAEIIAAIQAKQHKNEQRQWPDWRTADPEKAIEHNRSSEAQQPAVGSANKFTDFHEQQARDGASSLGQAPAAPIPPAAYASAVDAGTHTADRLHAASAEAHA